MSVNIVASTLSMPQSLDSLKTVTPLAMHRITFKISTTAHWYSIMTEARALYGKNWRAQPRVKRRLDHSRWSKELVSVWFEVPDLTFATWCAVKLGVEVVKDPNK